MTQIEEESFPRGGRIIPSKRSASENDNLFDSAKIPKKKPRRSKNKDLKDKNEDPLTNINITGILSYNKIQEGLICLSCIRHITNYSLEIELPGLTAAQVPITNISDSFTLYLNNCEDEETEDLLRTMFKVGDYVPAKIMQVENDEGNIKVTASINPSDINSGKRHDSFKKHFLLWACVKSILDHGYEISTGVKNCRTFLPSGKSENTLSIGQPFWSFIHRSETNSNVTTLQVGSKSLHINTKVSDIEGLHNVLPGMLVDFFIEKVNDHGLLGKFFENYFGYVDETFLKKSLQSAQDYEEGTVVQAYVLYVEPITNITYLSLRNIIDKTEPVHKKGESVRAQVWSKGGKGVYFKLGDNEKAFITNKRIMNAFAKNVATDVNTIIKTKFAQGTQHTCKILDYNYISQTYICTVESNATKEKPAEPVKLGQLVKGKIDKIVEGGLRISFGGNSGFVPNLHISNAAFSDNIKSKFGVHSRVTARVIDIHQNGNIILTMKENLVKSEDFLTSIEDAQVGNSYTGTVIKTTKKGVLVSFCADIKGWIEVKQLAAEGGSLPDPTQYFYRGQVVKSWVLSKNKQNILLTLREPKGKYSEENIKVGSIINVAITGVQKDKLEVKSLKGNCPGIIPFSHLSLSLNLCQPFLESCNVGDHLEVICAVKSSPVIFSRREKLIAKNFKKKPWRFEDLKKGSFLRTFYESKTKKTVEVTPFIKNFTGTISLNLNDVKTILDVSKLQYQQVIICRVVDIDLENKSLQMICNKNFLDLDYSVKLFSHYLEDVNYLKTKLEINYKSGDQILCKVDQFCEKRGCLVTLPFGEKGLVPAFLCPDNLSENETVPGIFINYDFKGNHANVCLKRDLFQKINKTQDGNIPDDIKNCIAEKLLTTDDYIIAVTRPELNRQLIYIPQFLYENDNNSYMSYYKDKKLKLILCGASQKCLMGISKKLHSKISKDLAGLGTKNRTRTLSETSQTSNVSGEDVPVAKKEVQIDQDEESKAKERLVLKGEKRKVDNNQTLLPGISSFFSYDKEEEQESSGDENEETPQIKKKKKLTPTERAQEAKEEEERISKIEKELADNAGKPKNVDDFERMVASYPNSSQIWISYISYFIAMADTDKARTIGTRALGTIDPTLSQEKFNVWMVVLRLECLYGTQEAFNKIFEDALRSNEPLDVYISVIQMLADTGKTNEMEEKIRKCRGKFKKSERMWIEIAKVYYIKQDFKAARNLKEAALKSIEEKKIQMRIILSFALLEFQFGDSTQGEAIFETIISSNPKGLPIWTTYLDQLIKYKKIEAARKVFERAICQKMNIKSMKTLFLRYRQFEEKFGSQENVDYVKKKAEEYILANKR